MLKSGCQLRQVNSMLLTIDLILRFPPTFDPILPETACPPPASASSLLDLPSVDLSSFTS